MKKYKFYKEPNGEWFIDLPEWTGSKADLQMVAGADTMLEMMAEDKNEVLLYISEEEFEGADLLQKIQELWPLGSGANYILYTYKGIGLNLNVWLCDVTLNVFGKFPNKIYIAAITE